MDSPLARIDLNLLVALRTLLEERSVSRAAEQLFITQPAMSKTLQRLRDLFNDPLFTRSAHGMVPTPKALELEKPLLAALDFLEAEVFQSSFDPMTTNATIRVCAPEMFAISTIPVLASFLRVEAPNVLLQSRNLLDDHMELLARGALDFTIYVNDGYGDDFEVFPIVSGTPAIWLRSDHPLASEDSIHINQLKGMPSVSVYLPDFSTADMQRIRELFEEHGIAFKPILETTQLLIALEMIARENAFMIGPNTIEKSSLTGSSIAARPIAEKGLQNSIMLDLCIVQHKRTMNSPLHRWIREHIQNIYSL